MFINVILFVLLLITLISIWLTYYYGHWKRKNVPGPEPKLIFGNLKIGSEHNGTNFMNIYNQYKSQPYAGIYLMLKKTLIVNDLDLIKNILIKDHHPYFEGHGFTFGANRDPFTQHLFNLEGEPWKMMRVKLTPTFTSSKMRMMYDVLFSCTEEMVKYLEDKSSNGKPIDYKDIVGKLGTDVIASCAFGIQSNSFNDKNAEFRAMGTRLLAPSLKLVITVVLPLISSKLSNIFIKERIPKDVSSFFYRTVRETVEYREMNNVRRNDFLQLLIDMKSDKNNPENSLSLVEITAQVIVFFVAGFETSSTTASFALLELIKNKEIMKSLIAEIDEAVEADGGKITYDTIAKMPFLTKVICETLRMYPPLPFLLRRCTKDYKIPDSNFIIEDKTVIVIPSMGIQRDPDIYPNPLKFDPERFTPENIKSRHICAYLPFGEGPRVCIGSRFGMMQVKLALVMTLRHFDVECISKIPEIIKINPKSVTMNSETNLLLKLTKRKLRSANM